MSKRKPSFEVEEVLPDDEQLGARSVMWKNFMDKYSKPCGEDDMVLETVCEMLDRDISDHSNASDVQSDTDVEDEHYVKNFTREDCQNQLAQAVAKRKRVWATSGLMELMLAVEDGPNLPSHLKVEKWLFNQNTGPFDMTQNRETIVTERNADGDRMRFSRKEEVTISRDADDADSLSTVDEKKYILQNVKDRNVTSKIKVIQTFRIKTNSSANAFAMRPKLHSISSFPALEEEPTASTSWLHKTSKSDSAFETGEDQSQNRSREPPSRKTFPAPVPASVLQPSRDSRRKKVFKKTVKKKSAVKSPSKRGSPGRSAQQYETALQHCGAVRKVATRRIHWQETSLIAESSSDESDQVFRVTRSKTKASPKRELRSKSSSRSSVTPEISPRKQSPRKKVISPRKTVDRELVGNFNAICLSPRKKPVNLPQQRQQRTPPSQARVDQASNLTELFSRANEKIANSTTVGFNTTTFSNRSMIPDPTQGIVVFKPQTIQSEAGADARIRITTKDLELTKVTKTRHLESFQKFSHMIHPNSSVLFFPSDSEDDEPLATQTTTTNTDGDLSYDDDDPILTFKPRSTGRLNVMEYRYH